MAEASGMRSRSDVEVDRDIFNTSPAIPMLGVGARQ